ncbi:MAG: MTH1187 family thiamine-binding protein [Dehalococcoidales bacterium]|nr:MTH1187 family thiamine-binding protein [Dehalococcoidales bacterium]
MVIAEVSVIPMGTNTASASQYVARAVRVLRQQKIVKYQLTAMGTQLEGKLDEVFEAAKKMHESVFGEDVNRVITNITIDDRRDKELTMEYKVQSVMSKI